MARRALVPLLLGALALGMGLAACGGDDSGSDVVQGSADDDQVTGTEGDDVLEGLAGNDSVEGLGGDDEISGGEGDDFLYGGEGDDRFLQSEDDAVDVHECGPGEDVVEKPDARDQVLPDCEEVGWTERPPDEKPYENTMRVVPRLTANAVEFTGACPDGCAGTIELRTPRDRRLLGEGRFQLAGGQEGAVTASLNGSGRELLERGGYVRVVLRVGGAHSGFNTYLSRNG